MNKKISSTTRNSTKGFTLIELLAVIIILGILMIIAVPSVTKYINDTRKKTYISIAESIGSGVSNLANSGRLNMGDKNTTYYIPAEYIKTENDLKSPYGKFTEAFVGVVAFDDHFDYYWISRDETGTGIKNITSIKKLDTGQLENDIEENEVTNKIRTTGIGNRLNIKILQLDGSWEVIVLPNTNNNISEDGGEVEDVGVPIASCPGCVYTTLSGMSNLYTSWNTKGQQPSIINSMNGFYKNYERVSSNLPNNLFAGVVINENTHQIDRAFVCAIRDDITTGELVPFCIEAYSDNSLITANKNVLDSANVWSAGCEFYSSGTYHCTDFRGTSLDSESTPQGNVFIGDGYNECGCYGGELYCISS